ncbi:molybdopterin-guanine dinucleotide biosynthesis protein B [bacterium]|nr:molybdopterin-guanine dinucleotide biosynthesis protein B [bacterium]
MTPVVSIVGQKNSGKTTLIEKVIPELKKRGYRIGTIKHTIHEIKAKDIDRQDKDTYRHQMVGAEIVILSGPNKLMLLNEVKTPLCLDKIRKKYLDEMDLILTEGYKSEDKPKIEVFRQEAAEKEELLSSVEKDNLVAVVSNLKFELNIPFFGLDDYLKVADFLEKRFIKKERSLEIKLTVNQKEIFLKSFISKFLKNSIVGMISSLHSIPENLQDIEVKIKLLKDIPKEK